MSSKNESGFLSLIKQSARHKMFVFMMSILTLLILFAIVEVSKWGSIC